MYKNVNQASLSYDRWGVLPHKKEFMSKCVKNGNPDTSFVTGFIKDFSLDKAAGLQLLYNAVLQSHKPACYVYDIILLFIDVELMKKVDKELFKSLSIFDLLEF